jgi:NADPH-dependent 2,4-dienoyl-CoA reductase/sulfur reductase-like enzyme
MRGTGSGSRWGGLNPGRGERGEHPKFRPRYLLMSARALTTQCCIVGGGPTGMMEGFLLARAGVDVVVLE